MAQCTEVAGAEHAALAEKAARRSVVLLKNQEQTLPLNPNGGNYFVCGPFASSLEVLLGNYYGMNCPLTTILEGITDQVDAGTNIEYHPAFLPDREKPNKIDWGLGPAKGKDAIIAVVGLDPFMEGEEGDAILSDYAGDRRSCELPSFQREYLMRVADECDSPLILVVTGGAAVSLGPLAEKADAVLWVGYPGQQGGQAVAEVLFGSHTPSGRLPFTVPAGDAQLPAYDDYAMEGRTYRFLQAQPEFPFGFGLSYTTFAYESLELQSESLSAGEDLKATVTVRNTGSRSGTEVVQLYLQHPEAPVRTPHHQLVAFESVELEAGSAQTLSFTVPADWMRITRENGERDFYDGTLRLLAGGCSPGARGQDLGGAELVTTTVRLTTDT
jgi:beta-glucosidase